jgi:hypothetical protein
MSGRHFRRLYVRYEKAGRRAGGEGQRRAPQKRLRRSCCYGLCPRPSVFPASGPVVAHMWLYEFVLNLLEESRYALRLDGREGDPVFSRSTIVVFGQRTGSLSVFILQTWTCKLQKRQVVSAFALTYILRLSPAN